jgi:tetratricopeptide (TPR) repeat protein
MAKPNQWTCFVAMPIRSAGSEEHEHFFAIYQTIADVVAALGIRCYRVDQGKLTGNINKEIVKQLAESDLVIADLTDLNPNVFYELGVRHALRRSGTILLCDKSITSTIPFDINQYKVIQYEGTLPGSRRMAEELRATIEAWSANIEAPQTDSPVHDWYPELPGNVLQVGSVGLDEELRKENVALRVQLDAALARGDVQRVPEGGVVDRIRQLQRAADAREMPKDFLDIARQAVQDADLGRFFKSVELFLTTPYERDVSQYRQLAIYAQNAGQHTVSADILRAGLEAYPGNPELQQSLWLASTRLGEVGDRESVIAELAERLDVDLETATFRSPPTEREAVTLVGMFADHLYKANKAELGLRVLQAFVALSDQPRIHAYIARQYEWLEQQDSAYEAFQKAILARGVEEDAFRWFGNFLHNTGYHVDATAMFTIATLFDLQDADHFVDLGNEIAAALYTPFLLVSDFSIASLSRGRRPLPIVVTRDAAVLLLVTALRSNDLSDTGRRRLQTALRRAQVEESELTGRQLSIDELRSWLMSLYDALDTDIELPEHLETTLASIPRIALERQIAATGDLDDPVGRA